MIENNVEKKQRAVLVAVDTGEYDARVSLDELEELAVTAGAAIRRRMCRRSVSSWLSPGPRVPMPPPSRESAPPSPVSRGSR